MRFLTLTIKVDDSVKGYDFISGEGDLSYQDVVEGLEFALFGNDALFGGEIILTTEYEDNNYVIGFIDFWITFDSATIAQIGIRKNYRGRGLANLLMQEMIDDCYAKKVMNITLEVRASNAKAISLYKKYNFKEIVIKPHYYDNGEDAVYMVRKEEY